MVRSMSRSKIALIGAKGQLGSDIVQYFSELSDRYELIALTRADIDITNAEQVRQVLTSQRFDVVVNSAAYIMVDDCEQEFENAFKVNAIGALNVARATSEANPDALSVYIGTDYVFKGDQASPYTESDQPYPISIYGTSKLTGEYLVQQTVKRSLILRISSVFGKAGASGKGGNFVETIIKKAKAGEPLKVVNDITMSPTYTYDVASLLDALLQSDVTGVIHGANAGSCSWHEFAVKALAFAGIDHPIAAIPADAFPTKARRPMNSALISDRLSHFTDFQMRPWQSALENYLIEKAYI